MERHEEKEIHKSCSKTNLGVLRKRYLKKTRGKCNTHDLKVNGLKRSEALDKDVCNDCLGNSLLVPSLSVG